MSGTHSTTDEEENIINSGSCIDQFSGKDLTTKKWLLAGIIEGSIKLKNDDGTESNSINFDGSDVSIFYGDTNNVTNKTGLSGDKGGYSVTGSYIEIPEEIRIADRETNCSTYPCPNSTFYIKVRKTKCNGYDLLSNISFTYRQTESTGEGNVMNMIFETKYWNLSTGSTLTTYQCDTCGVSYVNTTYDYSSSWNHALTCGQDGHIHTSGCFSLHTHNQELYICIRISSQKNNDNVCSAYSKVPEATLKAQGLTIITGGSEAEGDSYKLAGVKLEDVSGKFIRYDIKNSNGTTLGMSSSDHNSTDQKDACYGEQFWDTAAALDTACGVGHCHSWNCLSNNCKTGVNSTTGLNAVCGCGKHYYTYNDIKIYIDSGEKSDYYTSPLAAKDDTQDKDISKHIHTVDCFLKCPGKFKCRCCDEVDEERESY